MKAIQIAACGGIEVLEFVDSLMPVIKAGEVLVRHEAIGVNFIDTYQRSGVYKVELPFIPGLEGAGTVIEVGSSAGELTIGDRVAYCTHPGAYSEYAAVPAEKVIRLPDAISCSEAAAVMLQGLTAHYLALSTYPLKPGDTCLIHAAAGGVGLLLVQIAKQQGATVIGTVSTARKKELASAAGADEVILYTEQDFLEETLRLTDQNGVEVVYDSVGRETFNRSLKCLRKRGHLVLFGQSSGAIDAFNPLVLAQEGSLYLTRPTLFDYTPDRESLEARSQDVFSRVQSGVLKLRIGAQFPLAEAARAHSALEGRKTTGKVILIPDNS